MLHNTLKYISDNTKFCCNEVGKRYPEGFPYHPWLSMEEAQKAVLMAREETINEVKEKLLSEVLPMFIRGGEADEVVAELDKILTKK